MSKRKTGEKKAAALDLLIEIGTEELPASYVGPALEQLRAAASAWGPADGIDTWGTPRRLVLAVRKVEPYRTAVVWGPPLDRARDDKGGWNRAAIGFARSRGAAASELTVGEKKGRKYLKLDVRRDMGREIAAALPAVLESLNFPKSMRWQPGDRFRFARPIRWLVCLLGDRVLDVTAAGVKSGRKTRGHRFFAPGPWKLSSANPSAYRKLLQEKFVIVDPAERSRLIRSGIARRRRKQGGEAVLPGLDRELAEEVSGLVEYPRVIRGGFDPRFLRLPDEVTVTVMKSHQRYFPVRGEDGRLRPWFLIVANGPFAAPTPIRRGNERVLKARLADAEFFWKEDLAVSLSDRRPRLAGIVFHEKLGDYLEKVKRLEKLVPKAGRLLELSPGGLERTSRAAFLSKSDLTTAMVAEFTELQGVMGREYARRGGEDEEVARALYEQYLPRGLGDDLPRTGAGLALSLADKIDTLAGFLGAGLKPSGSVDPYGLRRQALGVVKIILGRSLSFPLEPLLEEAARNFSPSADRARLREEILDFILTRLRSYLEGEGIRSYVIQAVFSAPGDDLLDLAVRARLLQKMEGSRVLRAATTVVERTHNIIRGQEPPAGPEAEKNLLEEAAEKELYSAWRAAAPELDRLLSRRSYRKAVEFYARSFSRPLSRFFAEVMVNVADPAVRRNRMALLAAINRLFSERLADLSQLQFNRGEHLL